MNIIFTLLTILTLVLTGCAGTIEKSTQTVTDKPDGTRVTVTTNKDNSTAAGYQEAYKSHFKSEAKRLIKQTDAIMGIGEGLTGEAKGWADAFKVFALATGENFKPTKFQLEKSKTWIDVADSAVSGGTDLLKAKTYVGGAVDLAEAVIGRVGGDTNIVMGEGGSIDSAFNEETNESNASTLYGDAKITQDNSKAVSGEGSSGDDDVIDEDDPLYCTGGSQCEEGYVCNRAIRKCVK